ncbi:unnamed protein product [Orchesella dallaii]|uniref:Uncharacterized protein n=1 Tax=Orchesella dallaii TaxID=48710 RepID=A0ABP1Q362_9HEXA
MGKNSMESDNRSTNTPTRECNDVVLCSKNPSPHSSTQCAAARPIMKTVARKKLDQIEDTISGGIRMLYDDLAGVKNDQQNIRSSVMNLTTHVTQLVMSHRKLTTKVGQPNEQFNEFVEQFKAEAQHSLEELKSVQHDTWNLLATQGTHTDKLNRHQTTLDKLQGDINDLKEGQAEIKLELTRSNQKYYRMEMMIERNLCLMERIWTMQEEKHRAVNNDQPAQNQEIRAPAETIHQQMGLLNMPHQMYSPLMALMQCEVQMPPPATSVPLNIIPPPATAASVPLNIIPPPAIAASVPLNIIPPPAPTSSVPLNIIPPPPGLPIEKGRQPKRKTSFSSLASSDSEDNGMEDNGSDVEYRPNTKSSRVSTARKIWTRKGQISQRMKSKAVAPEPEKVKRNTRAKQPPRNQLGTVAESSPRAVSPTALSTASYRNLRSGLKAKKKI